MNRDKRLKGGYVRNTITIIVVVISLPLLPVLFLIYFLVYLPYCLCLYAAVWWFWLRRDKNILFVYSNSPHWKDYIETNILPKIADHAIVINWSERSSWDRWFLPAMCFRHFGGSHEYNPMAIVFRPLRRAKTFRFWLAFRDYKHGMSSTLEGVEKAFFIHLRNTA